MHNGILITRGGIIDSLGVLGKDFDAIPGGPATVINAQGGKISSLIVLGSIFLN
jgi:hypothetical protein